MATQSRTDRPIAALAGLIALALTLPAMAQVDGVLSAAPQPKVAAPPPAPSARPGEGGGPASAPGARQGGAPPYFTAMGPHQATLGWPAGVPREFVTSYVNHIGGEVRLANGSVISLENDQARLPLSTGGILIHLLRNDVGAYLTMIQQVGETLKVFTTISLASGELIDPPPVTLPIGGGSQTVALPGGGSLTLTVDGAHALTPDEQRSVETMQRTLDQQNAAAAARAAAGQPARGP
jgi:hypothetical protein